MRILRMAIHKNGTEGFAAMILWFRFYTFYYAMFRANFVFLSALVLSIHPSIIFSSIRSIFRYTTLQPCPLSPSLDRITSHHTEKKKGRKKENPTSHPH